MSTDNYFIHNGEYHYDPTVLGEAHEWNHKKGELNVSMCLVNTHLRVLQSILIFNYFK